MVCLANGTMTQRTADRFILLIYNRREELRQHQRDAKLQAQMEAFIRGGDAALAQKR